MKLAKILQTLREEPMLITPAAHTSLLSLLTDHMQLSRAEFEAKREGTGFCGEAVEIDQAELIDGIYHIPIAGPVGQGLSSFEKGAGAIDFDDITKELREAEENQECFAILLDVDSPGGMTNGLPECADAIAACEKPIYAFTRGSIASAAYWLASATDGIFATRSSEIGSIGVYCAFMDYSEAFKKEGLKVELFTSGKYKGAGYPGTSLTEPQRNLLKERISQLASNFYAHVRATRGEAISDDVMQGQTFMAPQALAHGLIDAVVTDKDECIDLIRGQAD